MEEAFVDGVEESDHGEDVICVDDVAPKNEIRKVCRIPSLYLIQSAASLCVHVGSFSDPPEAQGLAHFLEHSNVIY